MVAGGYLLPSVFLVSTANCERCVLRRLGLTVLKKSSGTLSPGNFLFHSSCQSSKTFSAHLVDLPVLAGVKSFENFCSVSLSVHSNRSLAVGSGCGSKGSNLLAVGYGSNLLAVGCGSSLLVDRRRS